VLNASSGKLEIVVRDFQDRQEIVMHPGGVENR
jgi:hypothetical protein